MKNFKKGIGTEYLFLIGILVVTGLIIWAMVFTQGRKEQKFIDETSREVAERCTTDMATQFHIHPELMIIFDGEKQIIPTNIGITDNCMHSIHTHDISGAIHVEAPIKKDFTLGDFFYTWGKPFDRTHILDKTADATHTITMTVNGAVVDSFENLVLVDKDKIVIEYKTVK